MRVLLVGEAPTERCARDVPPCPTCGARARQECATASGRDHPARRRAIADEKSWPYLPLTGRSGERIARLAGVRYVDDFADAANLYPNPRPKWRVRDAQNAADWLRRHTPADQPIVALGERVARAFRLDGLALFTFQRIGGRPFAVAPHPSGLSRWWNDETNVERARAFFRELARSSSR